jgi:hypothetical protein
MGSRAWRFATIAGRYLLGPGDGTQDEKNRMPPLAVVPGGIH